MLSQAKIDLAVLCKLYQHAESDGEAITPINVSRLFTIPISLRRIEVALEQLERKGEVDREYHPHYSDEGLWQISRAGLNTVDRAIRVPASFIARLHQGGDGWLQSSEASEATLRKLAEPQHQSGPLASDDNIAAGVAELNRHHRQARVRALAEQYLIKPVKRQWGLQEWSAVATLIGIPLAVLLWWFS